MQTAYMASLDRLTRASHLASSLPGSQTLVCHACAHHCRLAPGKRGRCAMRRNLDGKLMVPFGYASSVAVDPVEKKPFYHFLPGQNALSFGMLGCNLHCPFCQNWSISQTLRDELAVVPPKATSASALVSAARDSACAMIAATYNEPLISIEWAADIFREARDVGLKTCMISNGFAGPEALELIESCVDAMNVDLKCMSEEGYRWLGGRLQPVKDTITALWSAGIWIEVITLLVPGFNDSEEDMRKTAEFLVGVSPDLPWHVSAYHPDYKMARGPRATPIATLEKALDLGADAGLKYIYAGNVSRLSRGRDTTCPDCGTTLVTRRGFGGSHSRVEPNGQCPDCGARIAGVWSP